MSDELSKMTTEQLVLYAYRLQQQTEPGERHVRWMALWMEAKRRDLERDEAVLRLEQELAQFQQGAGAFE